MVKFPTFEKQKMNFAAGSTILKVNIEHSERVTKNFLKSFLRDHYCLDDHSGIDEWDFVIFEQCETYEQLKKEKTLGNTEVKSFTR